MLFEECHITLLHEGCPIDLLQRGATGRVASLTSDMSELVEQPIWAVYSTVTHLRQTVASGWFSPSGLAVAFSVHLPEAAGTLSVSS